MKTDSSQQQQQPLSEKSGNVQGAVPPPPPPPPASATPVRPSSQGSKRRRRRLSKQKPADYEKAQTIEDKDAHNAALNKENLGGRGAENVTALPLSYQLGQSPHLRPVDTARSPNQIPYNFRHQTLSQTSVMTPTRDAPSSRPGTLRSKPSTFDSTPQRRRSSKRRKDDQLREEEIRAMSATIPLPKRPGDGPLRRDSYKRRTLPGTKESTVSLPQGDTLHKAMSFVIEHRGWELRSPLGSFSPRPALQISSTPQYTTQKSEAQAQFPLSREASQKVKDKPPASRDSARKRHTVGAKADDLGSSDLRLVLERDAKRREQRRKEQQKKLERKLLARTGGGENEDEGRADKEFNLGDAPAPASTTAPAPIHPALRDRPVFDATETVGLGIGPSNDAVAGAPSHDAEDPFRTPLVSPVVEEDKQIEAPPAAPFAAQLETPLESPFEDPAIETAQEVRLSSVGNRPPLSPIAAPNRPVVTEEDAARQASVAASTGQERRPSEPRERRAGAWASFFRRTGTSKRAESQSPSETSFANTSRESMSRQPLPPHLVGDRTSPFQRTRSGTPVRTQSRFREDLPELPLSPPDSRVQSPELPRNAAATVAALTARQQKGMSMPVNIPGADRRIRNSGSEPGLGGIRSDTPVSPVRGPHGLMSASLASVDSEGSWLASGGSGKRASVQSGLSRGIGSLNRRTQEFNASFEDLGTSGGDKDAEYVQRTAQSTDAKRTLHAHRRSTSAIAGASPDEESEYGEAPEESTKPLTVHGSARRKPTLVHRDPAVRSREGLLTEYSAGEIGAEEVISKDDEEESSGQDSDNGARLESARSIDYGKGHARQVSAGSAILLDVPPSRRVSAAPASPKQAEHGA